MNTSISMDLPKELIYKIDNLASITNKTTTNIIVEALQEFANREEWQINEINNALIEADKCEFVSQEEMQEFWKKWS